MTAIGADPEALRELSRRFRKLHSQIEASRAELDKHLRNAQWHGYDADRFRRSWTHHHRPDLLRTAELCRTSAASLLRHADEQVRVSGSLAASGSGGAGDVFRRGSGNGSAAGLGRPGGPVKARDIPVTVTDLRAGAAVTIASVLIGTTHDIRIENLPSGTSRVTFVQVANVGAEAAVGASMGIKGQRAVGLSASAEASLGTVDRRTYVVDEADVWGLIAAVELGDAAKRVTASAQLIPGGGGVGSASAIGGWLIDRIPDPLRRAATSIIPKRFRPAPIADETLIQVRVAADASAAGVPIIGPFASLGAGFVISTGRSNGPDGSSSVFEVEGSAASDVHSRLIGESSRSVGNRNANPTVPTLRVEIPDSADGERSRRPIVITSTTTDGGTVRQSTTHLDTSKVVTADLAARTRQVLESLAHGDVNGAIRRLTELDVPREAVSTTTSTFSTDNYSGGVEAEVGKGVSVGLDLEGGVQRFKRVS